MKVSLHKGFESILVSIVWDDFFTSMNHYKQITLLSWKHNGSCNWLTDQSHVYCLENQLLYFHFAQHKLQRCEHKP
jgi:hypothetical protein